MMNGIAKRMGEAGAVVANSDAETLWTRIERMAMGLNEEPQSMRRVSYTLAGQILQIGRHEHWTTLRTALALAYSHMILSDCHNEDMHDLMMIMQRPIIVNRHCDNCLCADKSVKVDQNEGEGNG